MHIFFNIVVDFLCLAFSNYKACFFAVLENMKETR